MTDIHKERRSLYIDTDTHTKGRPHEGRRKQCEWSDDLDTKQRQGLPANVKS